MNPDIPSIQRAVQLVGPDQLILNERKPVPAPGPHHMLCRVVVVGLCFSDLKLLKQFSQHVRKAPVVDGVPPEILRSLPSYVPGDAPTVPGHEPVVEIVAVGHAVRHFRPGERYFVQADWRWVRTPQSNGAFGYNFEGALQEYVLVDERLMFSPEGECMLLPAPAGERSAAAFALVEPWACVEHSYRKRERRSWRDGGRALILVERGEAAEPIARWLSADGGPAQIDLIGWPASISFPTDGRTVRSLPHFDEAAPEAYDDIVYAGHEPDRVGVLTRKAARDGHVWIACCGGRFGRDVELDIGAIHYFGLRIAGTPGPDPREATACVPESGEVREGETVHVVGAGGPMGVMHVIRNLSCGAPRLRIVAADLSDERLSAFQRLALPVARSRGHELVLYNSAKQEPPVTSFDYVAIMAPVPALVAAAVRQARAGTRINIFAGIPMGQSARVDLDRYIELGMYMYGTSGSTTDDMRVVLDHVRDGRLDTNVSVAAVSGLDGAIDGIRAVEKQAIAGKILVYPACRGLGLTPISALPPEVTSRLRDGIWTREAEEALWRRYAVSST